MTEERDNTCIHYPVCLRISIDAEIMGVTLPGFVCEECVYRHINSAANEDVIDER